MTLFDQFWSAYPAHRRGPKPDARDAWSKHVKADQAEAAIQALHRQVTWPEIAKEDFRYLPHAHRWLRKSRWNDTPAPNGHQTAFHGINMSGLESFAKGHPE